LVRQPLAPIDDTSGAKMDWNMNYQDRIVRDPQIVGGEPILKGTRVTLKTVLASLAEGATTNEILADFPTLSEEDVRAAIAFAPTLVAGIYGMNFDRMPELHWTLGYPFAVLLMVLAGGLLWVLFKRNGWL